MISLLKYTCIQLLSVVEFLFRPMLAKPVAVLCYHAVDTKDDWQLSVDPNVFDAQLATLQRKGVYFCSADELHDFVFGKRTFDKPTVHITFDDGYESVCANALPILQKYQAPATVFVMGDFDASAEARGTVRSGLRSEHIKVLQQSGLVTIGYHGKTHQMLDTVEKESLHTEVVAPFATTLFAYPGGHKNSETLTALTRCGYVLAFTISGGLLTRKTHPLLVPRTVILRNDTVGRVHTYTTYAWHWYTRLARLLKSFL